MGVDILEGYDFEIEVGELTVTTVGGDVIEVPVDMDSVVIEIEVPGMQGPPGPAGAGGNYMTYNPGAPSATWIVMHNWGTYPTVTYIDAAGDECDVDTNYPSDDQVTVTFPTATADGALHLRG